MNMNTNPMKNSTQQPTSDQEMYAYFESITSDWTEAQELYDDWQRSQIYPYNLKVPNPPTEEQVKRAQFVDKTYVWKNQK